MTIICPNGHEREGGRSAICTICGLSMTVKPEPKKVVTKPKEEKDG